jgi:hypothetical protein
MKIVLTGATGFVGGEVLAQLVDHTEIDRVTCLSRKPLSRSHDKIASILIEDFAAYDEHVLEQIEDHSACIWTLGGKVSRHLKGRTEKVLRSLSALHPTFAAHSFRPGGILPIKGEAIAARVLAPIVVRVNTLARAMIHVAIHSNVKAVISNAEIKRVAAGA